MYILCITIHVKPEHREEFIAATRLNHEGTRQERGNLRFDVLQGEDDPNRFFLYEVYQSKEDVTAHQQTRHYAQWRDSVQDWMAEPRQRAIYHNLFPANAGPW